MMPEQPVGQQFIGTPEQMPEVQNVGAIDYAQYNYLQVYDKLDNAMDSVNAFKSSLSTLIVQQHL